MRPCFFIISLIVYNGLLFGDNISRFPISEHSEWLIYYETMDEDTVPQEGDEIFKLIIEGDTNINSKQYFKIFKSGHAYYNPVFYFEKVYVGAIRDENNKYYIVKKDQIIEDILYNFDLEPGDTIKSLVEKGMKVSSVEILNDGRKKISFEKTDFLHGECTNYNNTFFIESIGSMGGLLYESPCNHVGFREYCLACYSENGSVVYNNDLSTRNCNKNTNTNHMDVPNETIRLFYSKENNQITLFAENRTSERLEYQIYDMTGGLIYKGNLRLTDHQTKFGIPELSKGVYLLTLNRAFNRIVQRFIVL